MTRILHRVILSIKITIYCQLWQIDNVEESPIEHIHIPKKNRKGADKEPKHTAARSLLYVSLSLRSIVNSNQKQLHAEACIYIPSLETTPQTNQRDDEEPTAPRTVSPLYRHPICAKNTDTRHHQLLSTTCTRQPSSWNHTTRPALARIHPQSWPA